MRHGLDNQSSSQPGLPDYMVRFLLGLFDVLKPAHQLVEVFSLANHSMAGEGLLVNWGSQEAKT